MRRLFRGMAALALLLGAAGRANAERYHGGPVGGPGGILGSDPVTFNYAFIGDGLSGSGALSGTPNGDGSFTATSGNLNVSGDPLITTGTLFPNPSPPATSLSPSGFFIFDNQLFPYRDPALDVNGLLFTAGTNEINIWANGPGSYTYYDYNTATGAQFSNTNVQFFLIPLFAVPEPAGFVLMGSGVAGVAVFAARKRRNLQRAAA